MRQLTTILLMFFATCIYSQVATFEVAPTITVLSNNDNNFSGAGIAARVNFQETFPELNEVIVIESGYSSWWDKNNVSRHTLYGDVSGNMRFIGQLYGVGGLRYMLNKTRSDYSVRSFSDWHDDFTYYMGLRFTVMKFEIKPLVFLGPYDAGWSVNLSYRYRLFE